MSQHARPYHINSTPNPRAYLFKLFICADVNLLRAFSPLNQRINLFLCMVSTMIDTEDGTMVDKTEMTQPEGRGKYANRKL